MKTLYLDCSMGAAGDMLAAALLELCDDKEKTLAELNALGIPGVVYEAEETIRGGISGTHLHVLINHEEEHPSEDDAHGEHHHHEEDGHGHHHHEHGDEESHAHEHCSEAHALEDGHIHSHGHAEEHTHAHAHCHAHDDVHMHEHCHDHADGHEHCHEHSHEHTHHHEHHSMEHIRGIVAALSMPECIKDNVMKVYAEIADAESRVHGKTVEEIHFHEVGAMDAVADIAAVCWLLNYLKIDRVTASPVQVGGGTVRCAHGIMPVPAPATALLLRDIPIRAGALETELCTPTGAALLRTFAAEYGAMPDMQISKIGHGCGYKDFEGHANCVTAYLGETAADNFGIKQDTVALLSCNLDDMTAEDISYAMQQLLDAGAMDVYTTPIGMKKCRMGTMLSCICRAEAQQAMADLMLTHTSTLGVRVETIRRYVLERSTVEKSTPYGTVRVKQAQCGAVVKRKPEYDDLARIAKEQGMTIAELREALKAYLD